jgi:hypothetical protein
MSISKKKFGIQIIDLLALTLTITIQIVIQSIFVSRINYFNLIGFNWITFSNIISLSLLFFTWHAFFQFLGVYDTRKLDSNHRKSWMFLRYPQPQPLYF